MILYLAIVTIIQQTRRRWNGTFIKRNNYFLIKSEFYFCDLHHHHHDNEWKMSPSSLFCFVSEHHQPAASPLTYDFAASRRISPASGDNNYAKIFSDVHRINTTLQYVQ